MFFMYYLVDEVKWLISLVVWLFPTNLNNICSYKTHNEEALLVTIININVATHKTLQIIQISSSTCHIYCTQESVAFLNGIIVGYHGCLQVRR